MTSKYKRELEHSRADRRLESIQSALKQKEENEFLTSELGEVTKACEKRIRNYTNTPLTPRVHDELIEFSGDLSAAVLSSPALNYNP